LLQPHVPPLQGYLRLRTCALPLLQYCLRPLPWLLLSLLLHLLLQHHLRPLPRLPLLVHDLLDALLHLMPLQQRLPRLSAAAAAAAGQLASTSGPSSA
jgi:hypothetical protein